MERTKPATASVILARLTIPSKINRLSAKFKRMTIAYGNPGFPSTEALLDFQVYVYFRECANAPPIFPCLSSPFLSTDQGVLISANAFADSCFFHFAIISLEHQSRELEVSGVVATK